MHSIASSFGRFYGSSIGKKWIVALTGLVLVGFLAGHLAGNLTIFLGQDAMNDYAEFLHHFLHGGGVWVARIVLLISFVLHIVATIQLTIANRAAREQRYAREVTQRASSGSRWMILSGITILAFVIFHLLHYTFQVWGGYDELMQTVGDKERHDVYTMLIKGFSNPLVSLFYVIAIGLLSWHLSHGVASIFQTLGITTPSTEGLYKMVGLVFAIVIFIGYCAIPAAVLFGWVKA